MIAAVGGAVRQRRTGLWATAKRLSIGGCGQDGGQASEAQAVHGPVHSPPARCPVHSRRAPPIANHHQAGRALVGRAPLEGSLRPARISGRFPPEFLDTTSAALHELAAKVELATPERERWIVQTESFYDARGRVYLELSDATPTEADRALALLKTLVG